VAAFATDVLLAVPPAKGSSHVLRILRDLLTLQARGRTELARALRYAGRVMRKRGVVIVISDFVMTHPDHVWEPALAQLSPRCRSRLPARRTRDLAHNLRPIRDRAMGRLRTRRCTAR
ncbi:MAG: VWA domain-containing protein, partial [Chloroflexi bacterium]|nr:VWA domain-containing protein [Chloroflexota bacterium]